LPIVGINPDPRRNDGVLLPFRVDQAHDVVRRVLDKRANFREVTLAEANTNDGQRMLAFNDFFMGNSHARSTRSKPGTARVQSSALLVSTGAARPAGCPAV
jgi:NAD kinase